MKTIIHNLLIALLLTASPLGLANKKTNLPNAFSIPTPPAEVSPPQTPPAQTPPPDISTPQTPSPQTPASQAPTYNVPTAAPRYVNPAPSIPRTPSIPTAQPAPEIAPATILPPAPEIRFIDLTSPENAPLRLPEKAERNYAKNGAWQKEFFQPPNAELTLAQQANGRSYATWNFEPKEPENHLRKLFADKNGQQTPATKKPQNDDVLIDPVYPVHKPQNNEPEVEEIASLQYIVRSQDFNLPSPSYVSGKMTTFSTALAQGKSPQEAYNESLKNAHRGNPWETPKKLADFAKTGGGFIFDGGKVAFEVLVMDDIRAIYNAQNPIEFVGAVAMMTPIGKVRKLGKLGDAVDKLDDLRDARKFHPDLKIASNNPRQNIDLNIKIQEKGVGGNGMASLLPNLHGRSEKEALELLNEYGFSINDRKRSPGGWERLTTRFDTSEVNLNRITGRVTRHPIRQYDPKTGERITGVRLDREGKLRPRSLPHSDYPPETIRIDFDGDK